jgi:tetratricopeptide (TPR) repeat protein
LGFEAPFFKSGAVVCLLVLALCGSSEGQTYKVDPNAPEQTESDQTSPGQKHSQPEKQLGWGSNIQNARLARAAESALKSGDYAAAVNYAQRAADAAPNDAQLWFLLGYAARLAGKTQLSLDAFQHGLRVNPSSLDGLSGLAQTYARMGRKDEAQKLLERVVSEDGRRANDQLLLGEMLLQSGSYREALSPLQRGEQLQASARAELLMALAHEHLGEFKEAEHYLELAKHRSPDDPEVLRSLASYYRETGNYSAAVGALKAIRSGKPEVKAEMGYTYQLWGKQDEAAKSYVEAAEAAPKDPNLQLSAAQAELDIGNEASARQFAERGAKLDGDSYRLHAIRAELARVGEHNQEAADEYKTALGKLPEAPAEGPLYRVQLRINLVHLLRALHQDTDAQGQLTAAQQELSTINAGDRNREEYLRLRALVKFDAGDSAGALEDVHDALALNPKDLNAIELNGDLLVKMGRQEEAVELYKKVLASDPSNELALTSLGSVYRELHRDQEAEKVLLKLASTHPRYYGAYLALGDLYTARKQFSKAETEYRKAHDLSPSNSLVVAGGMNAAIEAHQIALAGDWLKLASAENERDPFVMREKERYLTWDKRYAESAEVGHEAIKLLPDDRDVVVYLGYDLLNLGQYGELVQLTSHYEPILPKDPTLPLLAGYVYKHDHALDQANAAFTRAIERGPDVATAYVNRGFVLHDQRRGAPAAADFESALKIEPKNGEAHLGLAYANLDLGKPRAALDQAKLAEKQLGDISALHLIRATAYGDAGMLGRAAFEYRTAIKDSPNDALLHLALGNTLYDLHQYHEAVNEFTTADTLSPGSGMVYAQLARSYAQLGDRPRTLHFIELAEKQGPSTVYLSTGDALNILGDRNAAMNRFELALESTDSDRIGVRLTVAQMMVKQGASDDARRQIELALMEAASGRTAPPTGSELLKSGNLFLGMHDYQLAQTYFQRALASGAAEEDVRVGLANSYLALGDTPRAEAQLAAVSQSPDKDTEEPDYQYLLAQANAYRQRRENAQALTSFGQAAEAAGDDQTAQIEMLRASADEGLRINDHVSFLSDFSVSGIFEDTTVYALDAQLFGATASTLPPPRSSLQTQWTEAFHLHFAGMPDSGGFFQVRNAQGTISVPSANAIVNRDTWDYTFNFGVGPTLHLGDNILNFNGGIQQTVRRDTEDPYDMNQNLFRQFLYLSTSSFYNWISLEGYAIRETGPFTENGQHSRDLSASVEFRVGRPWSNTGFITGWGARDEEFRPIVREFYYTSTYAGVDQKIGDRIHFRAIGEYLRAWRVEQTQFAIAQAFRPAGTFEFMPTRNWSVQASTAFSRNMGFHAYDAVQSSFSLSYAMPIRRMFRDHGTNVPLQYPIRFSAGMQQETFYNFTEGHNQQFRPYVELSIF